MLLLFASSAAEPFGAKANEDHAEFMGGANL